MRTPEASAASREQHHLDRIRAAGTDRLRFWKACDWLAAEAVRDDDVARVTQQLLGLVEMKRSGQTLPQELHKAGARLARAANLHGYQLVEDGTRGEDAA